MTSQQRKALSEKKLRKEGVPILDQLPCIESEDETKLRSAREIGIRIACLFCCTAYALDVSDKSFHEYLQEHRLWECLTPLEVDFLMAESPTERQLTDFPWRSEAVFILMWSVHQFDSIHFPREMTFPEIVPVGYPSMDESPWAFIESLELRGKSEILDASDFIYRLHWATRQASLVGGPSPGGILYGAVKEWHHAINWITSYQDLEWDDVTTDT